MGLLVSPSPVQSIRGVRTDRATRMAKVTSSFVPVLSESEENGDQHVNVAHLLEACRNYAEIMRQMGQYAVARDMENNIRKAQEFFAEAPFDQRRTLSSLLEIERASGIHRPGGVLYDRSAATGLLWLRRSLAFQNDMYSALLEARDPTEAAMEAYESNMQPYHGWALRKIFTAKFSSLMPPRKDMLATLGGFGFDEFGEEEEEATLQDLKDLVLVWRPIISHWRQTFEELDLEDIRRV
eukprot:CAMPEP_0113564148 /NCGR_PEP_ID=MMETSP0015_2-20120614/21455_1 /TAXON_ID=2838 /ORGANISM="Odontella" /LENGTH=238 /DNA_ID=CAMNT_0000466191 /DNA_START=428 /DNA_END=1144 /DNA_ORIENTATION=+ /assembly_acc=CAM_ASM_000160